VANINLTQEDADALLAMEKHRGDDIAYEYPSLGGGSAYLSSRVAAALADCLKCDPETTLA
jgi:hypothetical protein